MISPFRLIVLLTFPMAATNYLGAGVAMSVKMHSLIDMPHLRRMFEEFFKALLDNTKVPMEQFEVHAAFIITGLGSGFASYCHGVYEVKLMTLTM